MPTVESYTNELKHMASMIPQRISLSGIPNMQQRQLVVQFPEINLAKYPRCQAALERYCWPKNAKAQRWVRDPIIEGGSKDGKIEGLWRLVKVEHDKAKYPGLIVTLREGYASELMWDEAMLTSELWLQESEKYADIVFPNIDPEKVQAIVDAMPTYAATDFTVRGHVYTSTVADPWEYLRVKPEQQDDGSYVIRIFAAHPQYTEVLYDNYGTPEQSTKTYCHNVPKRLAASVVTTYNTVYGTSGTANYSTEQGTVDLIFYSRDTNHVTIRNLKTFDGCEYDEYTDYWYNYTKAEAEAFDLNAVYGVYASGYEYAIEGLSYSGLGRYTIITSKKTVKQVQDCANKEIEVTADSTTKLTIERGYSTFPSITNGTNFFEWLEIHKDRFCRWAYRKMRRTSTPGSVTYSVDTEGGVHTHTEAWNQPTVNFGTPGTGYKHRLAAFSRNRGDGTYNWEIVKVPYLFDSDQVEYKRYFDVTKENVVKIASGTNIGLYQRFHNTTVWVHATKRFSTEAEANSYAETGSYKMGSGVQMHSPVEFTGTKIYVFATNPWIKDGLPFAGT